MYGRKYLVSVMQLYEKYQKNCIHQEAFAIEQTYFYKTDRKVNPKKVEPFRYFEGCIPILITAPHAVRHMRDKKIKPSDLMTGSIAVLLHKFCGAHALVATKFYGGDPNVDSPCIFKDRVDHIILHKGISILIDVHGASTDRRFDIDIGTMKTKSLGGNSNLREDMKAIFQSQGIDTITYDVFPAERQNTITKHAYIKRGVQSLQLEINRKYRAHQNGKAFAQLMAGLTLAVQHLENERKAKRG